MSPEPGPLLAPIPPSAPARARLRRMKLTATGFLVVAALGYAATYLDSSGGSGVIGFVRAAAEAAMVGGLADWFAVTALFRHPLRLPIPHTAIIPENKDDIATKLGQFVTTNFLTPDVLAGHLDEAHLVARIATFLREPASADALAAEAARVLAVALDALDEDAVFDYVLAVARRDAARRSYAPVLGQLLARAVQGDAQRPLVDLLAARAHRYLTLHRVELRPQIKAYLESKSVLAWLFMTDRRVDRLIDFALHELEAIGNDPDHEIRRWLDDLLRSFAGDLENTPAVAARVDIAVRRLFEDERFRVPLRRFVEEATDSLRASLEDAGSGLIPRLSRFIQDVGRRVVEDPELEATIEGWLRRGLVHAVREYGDELTTLIERTVAGWNPDAAARRIELAVGRDLQFIRINGTVVGALAGLAIHAVTVAAH
ncbi:MAG TPA: DUF445 domain-containing protein [Mycobacteriales bacterium]|nr:DUF445 domain-containing protein [Mycobacteriales bacterium]